MDSIKILLSISFSLLEIILGLFFFILIRLYFKIEIIGILGILVSFFMFFTFIFNLGFDIAHLKFFSESSNSDQEAMCNGTFLFYSLVQYVIYIVLTLVLIPINPAFKFDLTIVYIFWIGKLLLMGESFFKIIFLSRKEIIKSIFPKLISTSLKLIFLLCFINLYIRNIWLLIFIYLSTDLIFFVIYLYLFRKIKVKKPNNESLVKYFKYSYPFFIISSLTVIINWFDLTIISFWFSLEEVANYFTAKQIYTYLFIIFSSIPNILISTFSKNITLEKNEETIKIIKKTDRILTLFVVPIVFLIIMYSTELIVLIFGDKYELAGQILSILSLNLIIMSIEFATTSQLKALGEVNILAKIALLKIFLSITLMIIFVSPFFLNMGILSGALALVVSEIIMQIIYRLLVYKKYSLGFYWGLFKNMIVMFLVLIIQLYLNNLFNYSIIFMPIFILLDLSLYFLILYIFKGIKKEDILFLKETINIRNIKTQIFRELKNN